MGRAVDAFIELKVDELAIRKRYDPEMKKVVAANLRRKAEGTFLWVTLACNELKKRSVNFINTRLVLGKLPVGLPGLYARLFDQLLSNRDKEMSEVTFDILRAVIIAVRPLHLCELAVVASLGEEGMKDPEVARRYAELSGSFLVIREEYVYFVHHSARDHLLELGKEKIFSSDLLKEHETLAIRCLQYICYDWKYYNESLDDDPINRSSPNSLDYPLLHWIEHSNIAGSKLQRSYRLNHSFFR